ncbi:phage tail domain-containing protein, partial [Nonomuraea pusilla]|uniref:phage tail domain-containing protein n=1 Tax=Nonomuraea pusilla TaxID=46177 RepID=UPI00116015EE
FAGMAARKAANTASSGTGVTFNLDASGTTGGDWRWAAVEIRPGSIDATVSAATVTAAGEVPAAAVRTGQTAHPATVTAAAEVPPPGVHAGQTAHPAAVTAAGEVPKPNVVAGSASLVKPSAVTAGAQVPAPSITAVQNRTLSPPSVTAGAEVPAPTVTATRLATITPAAVEAAGEVPSAGVTVPTLPGDNLTDIGQVELNGVVWGMGTRYRIREITGWESLPQIDDLSEEEPGRHGAYAGGSLAQRRIVTVALQLDSISDPTQVDDLLRQLRYDTRVLRDNSLWTFVVRGYSQTLLAYGKVTDRTGVMGDAYSVGAPEPVITITCPDPRRYELDQQSQVVAANASAPTQFINSGDVYTNPILRFAGPATNPMIINETLDRILAFDVTLMAGQLLVVDTNRGKAMLGSTDYGSKVADTISVPIKEWFLDVGANAISYETDAGGAAGVEVLWRSAFL